MLFGIIQTVTFAQALAIAAAQSPTLRAARATYDSAQVNIDVARAGYRPAISVSGSTLRGSQLGTGPGTSSSVSANLTQLIFDGGRVLAEISAAQSSERAARETYAQAAQQLAYNVGQAYFSALEARANRVLAEQIIKQDLAQEDLIKAQIEAGTASRVDLSTAHLPTLRDQIQGMASRASETNTEAAFLNVLGLEADSQVTPQDVDFSQILPPPLEYQRALQRAMLLRPDYLAAQQLVASADANARVARRGRDPQLSAVAGDQITSGLVPAGTTFTGGASVGLQITVPVYDQGITSDDIRQAEVQVDGAQAQLKATALQIQMQVLQAVTTYNSARDMLKQAEEELTQAQNLLADTQDQYRSGVTQLLSLLNAQSGLAQAENQRLTAAYALQQARLQYDLALGQLAF